MSEANFKSTQNFHESLLQKQQKVTDENQQEFIKDVREYIEQAKRAGSNIASTRERDQIRANLRYWGNYIYSIDKTFPDTELAPSMVTEKRLVAPIIGIAVFLIVVIFGGIQLFRSTSNRPSETPSNTLESTEVTTVVETKPAATPSMEAIETVSVAAFPSPTSVFIGSDVAITSPENGESVSPKWVFKGAYTNLEAGSTIHMFLVRSDRLYPIKDFFTVPADIRTGDWEISDAFYIKPEELEKAENLAVVPAACFDNSCREILANAAETGLAINELPSQYSFNLFRNSTRAVYRNAYKVVLETRLVYSIFYDGEYSLDLYTSKTDGSDFQRITFTQDFSEISPSFSPDGTKIVYVKRFRDSISNNFIFAIAVMDSNGENDHEITERTTNILENPQWSPDSSYISYAMGDLSQSPNRASWNIHIYNLLNKSDEAVFEEPESYVQPYHTWLPGTNSIVFEARPQKTGTSGFDIVSVDDLQSTSHFFDTDQDDIQPSIKSLDIGYFLTYTTVDDQKKHNIFAVALDSDQPFPSGGLPELTEQKRLTDKRGGEIVDGVLIAGANYPISDPDTNSIYYMRNKKIYRLEFVIEDGKIRLIKDAKDDHYDDEVYGDLTVEVTGQDQIMGFDLGFMETYFPIPAR